MTEDQIPYGRTRYRRVDLPGSAVAEFWLELRGERVGHHTTFKSPHDSSGGSSAGWVRCSQHGCLGEAYAAGRTCLAHSDQAAKRAHFESVARSRNTLSLRGHSVSQALWDEVVSSPVFVPGGPVVPISFVGAEISARICLDSARIERGLEFLGAALFAHVELRRCTFVSGLYAKHLYGKGGALSCPESTFLSDVDISYTKTEDTSTGFERCRFQGSFAADGVDSGLQLGKSEFLGDASFKHSKGTLIFRDCTFHGQIDLANSSSSVFGDSLTAHSASRIGPCESPSLRLPRASFDSRVRFDLASSDVDLSGAILSEGGLIEVGRGKITLNQVRLGGPLRVSGRLQEASLPEVTGLFNADAGRMSFARVDMSRCAFYGAHGLDSVDIEPTVIFPLSPRWEFRRRCIADEFAWRISSGHRRWSLEGVQVGPPQPQRSGVDEQPKVQLPHLDASQVAATYRELRRSLESKSDMPGAADFYYGEMEMRRHDVRTSRLDRFLISLYWLVSGYGLRPLRALAMWVLLIAVGTFVMSLGGFSDNDFSWTRASLFSARASLPGVPTVETLTRFGQTVELALRILGPILAALFLIALRARVMRKPSE